MAKADDELVNLITGLRTMFRKTNCELLRVDWIGDPGWTTGPDHVRPRQDERFEVLSGKLGLRGDGRSTPVVDVCKVAMPTILLLKS